MMILDEFNVWDFKRVRFVWFFCLFVCILFGFCISYFKNGNVFVKVFFMILLWDVYINGFYRIEVLVNIEGIVCYMRGMFLL